MGDADEVQHTPLVSAGFTVRCMEEAVVNISGYSLWLSEFHPPWHTLLSCAHPQTLTRNTSRGNLPHCPVLKLFQLIDRTVVPRPVDKIYLTLMAPVSIEFPTNARLNKSTGRNAYSIQEQGHVAPAVQTARYLVHATQTGGGMVLRTTIAAIDISCQLTFFLRNTPIQRTTD